MQKIKTKEEFLSAIGANKNLNVKNKSITIEFDPRYTITCECITFKSSFVTFINLNIIGSFDFVSCNVTFKNCKIVRSDFEDNVVINVENHSLFLGQNLFLDARGLIAFVSNTVSNILLFDSQVENSMRSILVTKKSQASVFHSTMSNKLENEDSGIASISVHSMLICFDCAFLYCTENAFFIESNSKLRLQGCVFDKIQAAAIVAEDQSDVRLYNSVIKSETKLVALITLVQSRIDIFRSLFENLLSNCVIAERESVVIVKDSIFSNIKFPPLLLTYNSRGTISNSFIQNVDWSGLAVRQESRLRIKNVVVIGCLFGLSCSHQSRVKASNFYVHKSLKAAIQSIDGSVVQLKDSTLSSSNDFGLTTFYGGTIALMDCKVFHFSKNLVFDIKENGNLLINRSIVFGRFKLSDKPNILEFRRTKLNGKSMKTIQIFRKRNNWDNVTCIQCHKKADGPYLNSCLHQPFCAACFNKEKLNKTCPLCFINFSEIISAHVIEDEMDCPICLVRAANVILLQCKHRFCFECINKWESSSDGCMICRGSSKERHNLSQMRKMNFDSCVSFEKEDKV